MTKTEQAMMQTLREIKTLQKQGLLMREIATHLRIPLPLVHRLLLDDLFKDVRRAA